jgi:predicted nuclease with RNAse H fold
MYIIGIDLSGPSNVSDTALVSFQVEDRELARHRFVLSANDRAILYFFSELPVGSHAVVGIDAPLSYNIGGGDRPSDTELRRKIIEAGLRPGSVMAPTMIRMVYLTLRGISVARLMRSIQPLTTEIVEVHPGAALALRGAPPGLVSSFKRDEEARWQLLDWLEDQGLDKAAEIETPTDHYVAACAAALAAWKWRTGESAWLHPAEPPIHPFDYAC